MKQGHQRGDYDGMDDQIKIKGVCYHTKTRKWTSSVTVNKKKVHLGYYKYWINAVMAKLKGEEEYNLPHDTLAVQCVKDFKDGKTNS